MRPRNLPPTPPSKPSPTLGTRYGTGLDAAAACGGLEGAGVESGFGATGGATFGLTELASATTCISLDSPQIAGGGGSVTSSQRGNRPVQAATPPQVGLQGLSDQQTSTPNSPNQDSSVPNNPCGCGDKWQQAIDEWDNYLDNLAHGELQQALNNFFRYYRDIGQPLNPNDYGNGIGP